MLSEFLWHRWAVRLVIGIDLISKSRAFGVKYHNDLIAFVIGHQLPNHANDAFGGAGIKPFRIGKGWQRVVGAKQVGGAVDQNQSLRHGVSVPTDIG